MKFTQADVGKMVTSTEYPSNLYEVIAVHGKQVWLLGYGITEKDTWAIVQLPEKPKKPSERICEIIVQRFCNVTGAGFGGHSNTERAIMQFLDEQAEK